MLVSKGLLAKLGEAAEKLSKALMNEGAGPEPAPLPEGFGIKVPKMDKPVDNVEAKPVEQVEAGSEEKVEAKPAEPVEATSGDQVEVKPVDQVEAGTGEKVEAQLVEKVQDKVEDKADFEEKPKAAKKVEDNEPVFNEDDLAIELAIKHWNVEDLRDEYRLKYEKVKAEGCGVCSKCRWTSGCMNCDAVKAWKYYVRQELGMMGVAKAVGKAKAKAKGVKGGGGDMTQPPHEVIMSTKC